MRRDLPMIVRLKKSGIDSDRVAISIAELTLFRKLAKPVTITEKPVWLKFKPSQTFLVGDDRDNGNESTNRGTRRPLVKEVSSGTGGLARLKGRQSGKTRKAICPPPSRGCGRAPGCSVALPQAASGCDPRRRFVGRKPTLGHTPRDPKAWRAQAGDGLPLFRSFVILHSFPWSSGGGGMSYRGVVTDKKSPRYTRTRAIGKRSMNRNRKQ
ncbi:unnamed protein product [Ectocarpus sp. 12 AP-2014]